ncbi:hypothetical protein IAQ61_001457 [Plenodomus lingam]|nr:hypothetical protein IAQ61_001457 [Plenodomus lingam]
MSSRNRQSRTPASRTSMVASSARREATDDLPPYKKPSHPLDAEATRALRELQGRNLDSVKKHNKQATTAITQSAESVNDMLREHAQYIERRQKKWDAGKSLDDKEEEERTMAELQEKVNEATTKLEESMRAIIDSTMATQRIDSTLDWLRENAPRQLEAEYMTQMSQRASQLQQSQLARQSHNEDSDADDQDIQNSTTNTSTPGPTPLTNTPRIALTGPSHLFTTRLEREKDAYTALSLTTRYARHNDYRDFRRLVHDAQHGDSGPPLGHEDTWFSADGSPAPGLTHASQRGGAPDSDDDLIVDKASISTRCPLTYQRFQDPWTSTKCPHTFERNAILEMIRGSAHRVGGSGERVVECPIQGCAQLLTAGDLRRDPILIRRIRRLIRAEEEGLEEDEDEEEGEDAMEEDEEVKIPGTQHTVIEDLGDPSDTDE